MFSTKLNQSTKLLHHSMLSFKAIVMLLWTLAATAILSHAAAIPSAEQWRRADEVDGNTTDVTTDDNTTNFTRPQALPTAEQLRRIGEAFANRNRDRLDAGLTPIPPQTCTGPESISSSEFVLEPGVSAETEACMGLLRELQLGGRSSFVQRGEKGKFSADGRCGVFWTSGDVNAAQVSFDDLVAPVAFALARGSRPDENTGGVIKNYRLAGVCTDVLVGFQN